MSVLLSFIPEKDLFYGALLLVLLIAGFFEYRHIESIGAAKVVAADTKLADEVKAHNADLQTAAAKQSAAIEAQYESDLGTLSTPAPHVVCSRPAPHGDVLPQTAGGSGGAGQGAQPGVPAPAAGDAGSVDIGPPLTVAAHNADAQIKALQADVADLLAEMAGAK